MSRDVMILKQCDICGAAVVLTHKEGVARYICVTCKAVYRHNGIRDMSYDIWVWTYQIAGGKATPIMAPIPNTEISRFTLAYGVSCAVYYNTYQHVYHVFAADAGALLGTGKNKRDLLRQVNRELNAASKEDVVHDLTNAADVLRTQAVCVPLDVFFNRVFSD